MLKIFNKQKIFCVGMNKTGTTSLEAALKILGFKMGVQEDAELLLEDWAKRDFKRIIAYCKTADAFQDIPFSLEYTYQILDQMFPGSRFILTKRNNGDEWYESLLRHHTVIVGKNRVPTPDDLKEFSYRHKGWLWLYHKFVFDADETTLFDKHTYLQVYHRHNALVLDYFKYRSEDLLVLKPSEPSAMELLCEFLKIKYCGQSFPYLNKSKPDSVESRL